MTIPEDPWDVNCETKLTKRSPIGTNLLDKVKIGDILTYRGYLLIVTNIFLLNNKLYYCTIRDSSVSFDIPLVFTNLRLDRFE